LPAQLLDPANSVSLIFINCTNCGPRYTIIKDVPYDRDKTTMARFPMCPECAAEYEDPLDRRFHAQPNACAICGPRVWLEDAGGKIISERDEAVKAAVGLLDAGSILAVKGLGGFHLAVKATDGAAVARLRGRKIREEKPFAVMFSSMDEIRRHCHAGEAEEALLIGPSRPIVLLSRRATVADGPAIADSVAPRNRFLGTFLPYTPLHSGLRRPPRKALVKTSAIKALSPEQDNRDARSPAGHRRHLPAPRPRHLHALRRP